MRRACRHIARVMGRGLSLPVPAVVVSGAHHGIIACVMGRGLSLPVPAAVDSGAHYGIHDAIVGQQRLFSILARLAAELHQAVWAIASRVGQPNRLPEIAKTSHLQL